MNPTHRPLRSGLLLLTAAACSASAPARADDTVRRPGDHFRYFLEVEPHFSVAYADWTGGVGGGAGYGAGARLTFPVVHNGFVPTINNSVGVGVGLDVLHFGCSTAYQTTQFDCSLNSLSIPVVMQWNFYVARDWSVFGEPGLFVYHQFFSYSGAGCSATYCPGITSTSVLPALYVGARYRLNERLALTFRLGYPTLSVGISFLD